VPSDVVTDVIGVWSVLYKVLFVYKEFCHYESGTLTCNFWRRLVFCCCF